MPLKEKLPKREKIFTGFVVTYDNGNHVYEKENYFSKKLNKKCATNWAEIDKSQISSIELFWKGKSKAIISKVPSDIHEKELKAKDWFFSHKGYLEMTPQKVVIISRNIGYIEDNILYITSILEQTGEIQKSIRTVT